MCARNVVVRSGARGSFVLEEGKDTGKWMRPFHTPAMAVTKVVDTVGAGNSFLVSRPRTVGETSLPNIEPQGGLCAGLVLDPGDLEGAVRRGAVSAGLMIEQAGFPSLSIGADGAELWNGTTAHARLDELERLLRMVLSTTSGEYFCFEQSEVRSLPIASDERRGRGDRKSVV